MTCASPVRDPEAPRVARLRRYARVLDSSVRVPGTSWRLGVDSIVGLVPGIGDAVGAALSLALVYGAHRSGARRRTVRRMLTNVALEGLVGTVPVLGDLFDIAFRANERNVALLERDLADRNLDGRDLTDSAPGPTDARGGPR